MGLIRQVLDMDIVFTSEDGLTTNTITKADIMEVNITQQELVGDKANFIINNLAGVNKTNFYEGYLAEVKVQFTGEGSKTTYWLGRVMNKYPALNSYASQQISVDLMDEGTYLLSGATTSNDHTYSSVDAGYIINDLIHTYCTDLGHTHIDVTTGTTISMTIPVGRNILDTIRELCEGTGFTFFITEGLEAYLIERGTGAEYTLDKTGGSKFMVDRDILAIKNAITVKGAFIADATSTSQVGPPDGYWDIDNASNRRLQKFSPAGSIVQLSVTAWNSTTPASTHNLVLRLQPDDGTGTAPLDVTNYNADMARIYIPSAAIPTLAAGAVGGVTNASLIAGVTDYWLIVESDSASGDLLTVGYVTGSPDALVYEVFTRDELIGTATDVTSQGLYGVRNFTYTDRTLQTQDEVDEKADALLAEYKDISNTVSCELVTDIFSGGHPRPGDKFTVTLADEDISEVVMGLISITWSFSSVNGVWAAVDNMLVANTSPALTDGDWAAQVSRQIGTVANNVSVLEAAVATVGVHGWDKHSSFTLSEINAKLTDAVLDEVGDSRPPTAHNHEAEDDVLATGITAGKVLTAAGDDSTSWEDAPGPEGTAVKSTGEAGGIKFLREDGDGTCSWQAVTATSTDVSIICYNGTGGSLAAGSICYVSADHSGTPQIAAAKGDAVATTRGMMVMVKSAIADTATGSCWVIGKQAGFTGLTAGMPVYLSCATAAGYTQTIPTTSAHHVRIIGYATSTTEIYFNPDKTYIKRT